MLEKSEINVPYWCSALFARHLAGDVMTDRLNLRGCQERLATRLQVYVVKTTPCRSTLEVQRSQEYLERYT